MLITINTAINPVDYTVYKKGEVFSFVLDKQSSGEDLIIHINDFLKTKKWSLSNLTHLGVVPGPGSFTGLRSGLSFAQGINLCIKNLILFEKNTLSLMMMLNENIEYSSVSDKKGGAYIMKKGSSNIFTVENYNEWIQSVDKSTVANDIGEYLNETPLSRILYNEFSNNKVNFVNNIKPFYVHNPKFKERKV